MTNTTWCVNMLNVNARNTQCSSTNKMSPKTLQNVCIINRRRMSQVQPVKDRLGKHLPLAFLGTLCHKMAFRNIEHSAHYKSTEHRNQIHAIRLRTLRSLQEHSTDKPQLRDSFIFTVVACAGVKPKWYDRETDPAVAQTPVMAVHWAHYPDIRKLNLLAHSPEVMQTLPRNGRTHKQRSGPCSRACKTTKRATCANAPRGNFMTPQKNHKCGNPMSNSLITCKTTETSAGHCPGHSYGPQCLMTLPTECTSAGAESGLTNEDLRQGQPCMFGRQTKSQQKCPCVHGVSV